jgi:hypothetical protein
MTRTRMTAIAGIGASLVSPALVLLAPAGWPTLLGALVLAAVPAGAAVMCWLDSGDVSAQAGLTLTISLAALAIVSALMIWADAWHPRMLLILALAGLLSCGVRLQREQAR